MMQIPMLSLIIMIIFSLCEAQPEGWHMTDRFYGFRYELVHHHRDGPAITSESLSEFIQRKADDLGCFGWVQKSRGGTALVGEARCAKQRGIEFKEWLQTPPEISPLSQMNAEIRVYEDTKIRLHFSHFKIVEASRDTCFLDPPHKCPDIPSQDDESVEENRRDEL